MKHPFQLIAQIKTRFTTTCFFLLFYSFTLFAQKDNSINLGFCYPISNHGVLAAEYSNIFSFNVLAGVSKEEKYFTLAGLSTIVKGSANGLQIAGLSNFIGGHSRGLLIAGLVNKYDSAKGAQIGGLTNIASGPVKGLQLAGLMNISKDQEAVQIAGFTNLAKKVKGLQIAGFINKADDVEGAQIGGFINIAKNVKGLQIAGFINIADSSNYTIGVINIIKNGEKSIGISTDETWNTLLSFRSGGKFLYSIIGTGFNLRNKDHKYAFEGGLGANLLDWNIFRLRAEAVALSLTNFRAGHYLKSSIRLLPSIKILDRLVVYGGPAFHHVITNTTEGKQLAQNFTWDKTSGNQLNGIYLGVTGGISVTF